MANCSEPADDYDVLADELSEHSPSGYVELPTDEGLRRNDLCLPAKPDGTLDWSRILDPEGWSEFQARQNDGSLLCCSCSADVSGIPGNYGYIYCCDDHQEWEEKHLLSVYMDLPSQIKCLRCYFSSVPCRFFAKGYCARGEQCAYKH